MVGGCHRIGRQRWRIERCRRDLHEAAHLREQRRALPPPALARIIARDRDALNAGTWIRIEVRAGATSSG
jgi:hypothetical protein